MIKLETLSVRNFRGIRVLDLEFGGKNFAVQGPNGSGKSGVVDAIEFALTGGISRLKGSGTAGVSPKKHGPHVDYRDKASEATVELQVTVQATGNKATIVRSLGKPNTPTITPNNEEARSIFQRAMNHPEFVLSRREVIKYILVEARKRSIEIQTLLKLERIDEFSTALKTASNTASKNFNAAEGSRDRAQDGLRTALSIEDLSSEALLAEINRLRVKAGVSPIEDLEPETTITVSEKTGASAEEVSRSVALRDLASFRELFTAEGQISIQGDSALLRTGLTELEGDPTLVSELGRKRFLELGLEEFDGEECPFCGTAWEEERLRARVVEKLARIKRGAELEKDLLEVAGRIRTRLQRISARLSPLVKARKALSESAPEGVLDERARSLTGLAERLSSAH
ncbi:MAG: ATP-binding protein, partial [Cyanobacteria bacterium J06648_11]